MTHFSANQARLYQLWRRPEKVISVDGCRGSGKSKAAIFGSLNYLHEFQSVNMAACYGSQKQYDTTFVTETIDWCYTHGVEYTKNSSGFMVRSKHGGWNKVIRIIVKDNQAAIYLKGITFAVGFADEAADMDEDFLFQLDAGCREQNSKMILLTNPIGGPRHWYHIKYVLGAKDDPDLWHIRLNQGDNTSLPTGYYARLRQRYPDGHMAARMLDGEWVAAEGGIYTGLLKAATRPMPTSPPKTLSVGLDVAHSTVTHGLLIGEWPAGCWVIDEYFHDRRTHGEKGYLQQATEMVTKFKRYGTVPDWVIDPSGVAFAYELRRAAGTAKVKVRPGDNRVNEGIDSTSIMLSSGELNIHPDVRNFLDQMEGYSWDEKASEKSKDVPIKRDDHGPDAIRYWVMDHLYRRQRGARPIHFPAREDF